MERYLMTKEFPGAPVRQERRGMEECLMVNTAMIGWYCGWLSLGSLDHDVAYSELTIHFVYAHACSKSSSDHATNISHMCDGYVILELHTWEGNIMVFEQNPWYCNCIFHGYSLIVLTPCFLCFLSGLSFFPLESSIYWAGTLWMIHLSLQWASQP